MLIRPILGNSQIREIVLFMTSAVTTERTRHTFAVEKVGWLVAAALVNVPGGDQDQHGLPNLNLVINIAPYQI